MGTNQLLNLRTMVINAEATPGTYLAPEAADFDIRIQNPEFSLNLPVDDENAKSANGSHAEFESIAGTQSAQITCRVRANYSGSVDVEPKYWGLAKMCGCQVLPYSTDGLGLVRRASQDDTTYSIAIYDTEIGASPVTTIYQFAGCVGNMVLAAENLDSPLMANFTIQGKLNDIVDGTKLTLQNTVQTQLQEHILGATVSRGGTIAPDGTVSGGITQRISSFSFDIGNEINPIYDQSETEGILHFALTGARPRLSINPLAVKQASPGPDWLNEFLSETTSVINLTTTNFKLNILDSQLLSPSIANREQFVSWDMIFKAIQNGVPDTLIDSVLTLEDTWELVQGLRS